MSTHCPPRDLPLRSALRRRRGTSLIETQIAFVVLGIGLAGVCPIVAMHYRQLTNLEGNLHAPDNDHATYYASPQTANAQRGRLQAFTFIYNSPGMQRTLAAPGQIHYVVPWNNPWARKLASRAQIVPAPWTAAGSLDPPVPLPEEFAVTLQSLSRLVDQTGKTTGLRAVVELQ